MDEPLNEPLKKGEYEFVAYPVVPLTERMQDFAEELRVRWLLLDAQAKQVILLGALYVGYTLLDVIGAVAKARAGRRAA